MLTERLITTVIFVPILFLAVYFGGASFLIFVAGTAILGLTEFYDLQRKRSNPQYEIGIFISFLLCISIYRKIFSPIFILIIFLLLSIIVEMFKAAFSKKKERFSPTVNIATTILGVLYVTFLMSYLFLIREKGVRFLYLLFFGTWCCDAAAYFIGKKWGTFKLIPKVSPKKSLQGAIAGVCASLAVFLVARLWVSDFSLEGSIILGLLTGIFTIFGDLCESFLKRDVETKDSGDFIPGHGGILDRFDSLLFTAPLMYYYLSTYYIY
ncbi:hypothetical protein COY52_03870 [Candidatus Desantisbacteria bacterium CG_4_10_14_0_8_um_filter_48_22]|uniref:Phosphatidate cytidylyltransferase n=1 Tax=Candidatus Desantisbacteria bacterium CG_4_10_14_0_8_um_filter_48_22 TaxID=1974543 RepID=A0A2M7SDI0_9BACT|nr:MAG: hypothetical protein AUJ67_10290 [Candidatus Desantisbacteria bacterium CG1_02_49_89]PIV55070.1 MAG: hypothetical protein COS16_08330 [Candidatus Desantisbacteria bacterium CG02_land_8_20_14_3_00_49_13]PIZ17572.1 MAG: hypothetical protein COY52_03870 [Candidatus Desantisbacteria bacterium CG_4_10_14_0_8_um_filter_48_22]